LFAVGVIYASSMTGWAACRLCGIGRVFAGKKLQRGRPEDGLADASGLTGYLHHPRLLG
jgi:hypothetical protein